MNEIERILDQLRRAHSGDPWYGGSLRGILYGLDEDSAQRRVVAGTHTIAEIASHIAVWQREVARRLRDGVAREPERGDWPEPGVWSEILLELEDAHQEIVDAVASFPVDRLDDIVGEERDRPLGSGVSFYVMLHGLIQHNIAHAAQISLLRKAIG